MAKGAKFNMFTSRLRKLLTSAVLVLSVVSSPTYSADDLLPIKIPMYKNSEFHVTDPLECMALNLYHEARGESVKGLEAIAHVVMTRSKDSRFKNDVCSVVYYKGWSKRYKKWVAHFSWTLDGRSDKVYNKESYIKSYIISLQVMSGIYDEDPTWGATHYHRDDVYPAWINDRGMVLVAHIGRHKFYRWNK